MTRSVAGRAALDALHTVVAALPEAEERAGQDEMSYAIAESLAAGRSIIVQAGTGTGKSLGYLVPALMSGKKTVVATATKTLQDQLAKNDLPLLAGSIGLDFSWAVLKGRSNYLCVQRVKELDDKSNQLEFAETTSSVRREIEGILEWSRTTATGDIEEMPRTPSERARKAVTVGTDECPGRAKCPSGESCWAEHARAKAQSADVVVVNLHLYGLHVASGGAILPEHEVVIFDEVHQLESIISDTAGVELRGQRFAAAAAAVRSVIADPNITNPLESAGDRFAIALSAYNGQRLSSPLHGAITTPLSTARIELNSVLEALRAVKTDNETVSQRSLRAQTQCSRLAEAIDLALGSFEGYVAYVDGPDDRPVLHIKPLHVGPVLEKAVWSDHSAVLTSATVPSSLPQRVGLDLEGTEQLVVGSPFDYERNSRLYCSPEFPDRNARNFRDFVHDELEALINAAGGRTLGLFTSNAALNAATEELRTRVPFSIRTPAEFSRQRLIEMFMEDEHACIFASQSFFQGVDLPGRTLSLVVLDKLPFPRPDEPLLEARREDVGREKSFGAIDLPICATALAQAAGRLIRTATDKGVVAVLDRRLATQSYWRTLIAAMPPMTRTRDRAEVEQFLRDITSTQP